MYVFLACMVLCHSHVTVSAKLRPVCNTLVNRHEDQTFGGGMLATNQPDIDEISRQATSSEQVVIPRLLNIQPGPTRKNACAFGNE